MTTLNTIIEEEKKLFDQAWLQTGCNSYGVATKGVVKDLHIKLLTTAMQCAYEAGQEERDTYWKERVGEIRLLIAKYAKAEDMDVAGLVNEINTLCK